MHYTPGFILVLHTFGRDLKWNPHIHCLLSEGGLSDSGFWKNVKHFNYTSLRNAFQTALLNELEAKIGPSFKKTKALCYKIMNMAFMFMPNQINVTQKQLSNILADILAGP